MNRKILSIFFLIIGAVCYGKSHDPKWDNVTIYEYGDSLTSCECNFENLFRNWSKWVTNHGETVLLSYKYVETLNDRGMIDHYSVSLNIWESLYSRISHSYSESGNSDTTIYARELHFHVESPDNIPEEVKKDTNKGFLYRSEWEFIFQIMRDNFQKNVNVGDKVYLIELKIGGKKHDHYVICRPGENKIVFDHLFLGIHEMRERIDKFN